MTEPLSLVFLPASGAAQDAELLAEFTARLAPDVHEGLLRIAGSPPEAGLCVILLPASPDLVSQRSLWEAALAAGRKHERRGVAQLMVLHLRPHDWSATAVAGLAKLPADGRAITEWPRRDAAWDDVVRCLRAIAVRGYLAPQRPATPPLAAPITVGEAPSPSAGITADQLLAQLGRTPVGAPPRRPGDVASPAASAPFSVPFPPEPSLIGREATIAEIAGRLHHSDAASPATPIVLLQGPAGAGKRAVLVAYAHQYRSAYPGGVFWLDFSAGEDGYLAVAGQLGLLGRGNVDRPHRWLWELPPALSARTGWLLLVDAVNPARPHDADQFLSSVKWPQGAHALVATSEDLGMMLSSASTLSLAPLHDTSGSTILCATAGRSVQANSSEAEVALAIARALGGQLAALQLAGAHLAAYPEVSFQAYLDLLAPAPIASDEGPEAAEAADAGATAAPQAAFAASWRILTPAAREVFRVLVAFQGTRLSTRRLTMLAALGDEAMVAATAQLRQLLFLDERALPMALRAGEGVAALAGDALGDLSLLARSRADSLFDQLEDLGTLQREIAAGGAAVLLAELKALPTAYRWRRRGAMRWLDAVSGGLSGWDPASDPDRVLVQLRDWAFEAGERELKLRAEKALQAGARPWLRRRTATSPSAGRVLGAHEGAVTAVLLSPDGRLALSGSEDGTARCWDLERGTVAELRGHRGPVRALALAPDARLAITASDDGTLKVWALPAGTERCTLEWHVAGVYCVAVTPDGLQAASAAHDGHLCLWDLASGAPIRTWYATSTSGAVVTALVATPDDPRLVVAWSDGRTRRLHLDTGSWIDSNAGAEAAPVHLAAVAGGVRAVAVDERGAIAVTPSPEHELLVWDSPRGELRSALAGHTGTILCADLSADGERAISGSADWTVRLWDLARGSLPMPGDQLVSTAMIQDTCRTVSLTFGGALALWDTATGRLLRTLPTLPSGQRGSRFVTALPGSRVLVTNPGGLEIWDLEAGHRVDSIAAPWEHAWSVVASAGGRRAAVAARTKMGKRDESCLFLLDLETGARLGAPACDYPAQGLALLDDDRLLVGDPQAGTVRCVDLETGATIRSFAVPDLLPGSLVAAPQGRRIVCATQTAIVVVDADSGDLVLTIPLAARSRSRSSWGPCMAITPDAQLLCLVTDTLDPSAPFPHVTSSDVTLHEIPSGRVVARLALPFTPGVCALSPDGTTVVLGASPRVRRKVMRRRGDDSHYGWFTEILETQACLYFVDYVR